jgi:gamma-glutamylcyclotransferase (GGCT)/AIG2-like uncharacterized protein YtfP
VIPLFVYGTLRPGFRLWSLIAPAVCVAEPAFAAGALYHLPGRSDRDPVYPLADFHQEGWISGDVLWVDPTMKEYEYVEEMELSSGYTKAVIPIMCDSHEEPVIGYGFHYWGVKGPKIEEGEWAWNWETVQ